MDAVDGTMIGSSHSCQPFGSVLLLLLYYITTTTQKKHLKRISIPSPGYQSNIVHIAQSLAIMAVS